MGKTLIITEKPSVAREYAQILSVSGRRDGFLENQDYVITWCVGHLIEMSYPEKYDQKYKRWKMEDLPFLPEVYKYDVINSVAKQYKIVTGALHRDDISTVLWAGDSGREGQVIEELIRMYGGVREGMEEKRVWIDSCTEEEVQRGMREAKPYSAYTNLANAGIMRSIEDYAMGINFSRALSVKYGQLLNNSAGTKKYAAIAVGRVMTCVLGMVVRREREIRDFKETFFYRIIGSFSFDGASYTGEWKAVKGSEYFESPKLYSEKGFKEEKDAKELINKLLPLENGKVSSITKSNENKRPPLLFNLAELQAICTKKYKISPDQTLNVAQELYEKKLTTYPRTDARVLSTAAAKEIVKNLNGVAKYPPTAAFTKKILEEKLYSSLIKSQYTDDSKVTDHYAIIPTGNVSEYNNLSELSKRVYDTIVRRFLSIFYPPAVYEKLSITTAVGKEKFYTSSKVLKDPGFLVITGQDKQKDEKDDADGDEEGNSGLSALSDKLHKGDTVKIEEMNTKTGKTSPPKRYSSGSMILAMENAGQLIEDEELRAQIKGAGIGTSATRAGIIEKLIKIGYIAVNKKTQILTPMPFGEMVYEVVFMTMPSMLNPEMTASWEKGLSMVEDGSLTTEKYRETLEKYVTKYVENVKGKNLSRILEQRIRAVPRTVVKSSDEKAPAKKKGSKKSGSSKNK
ncbi:MAG: type IA DNA topoisomerase [Lachnospiraceae bacterium]|nr:type IA DNA topoisomerase [Lachnospiraceae bacterium]